jgi:glycosyltransferase involved in cell wall biosynthesis
MFSDFLQNRKLLYVSMHDLTIPNGPGVNEFECSRYLKKRYPNAVYVLAPKPRYPSHSACEVIDETFSKAPLWNLPLHFFLETRLKNRINELIVNEKFDCVLARMSLFPWALVNIDVQRAPLFLKTVGEVDGFTRNKGLKGVFARCTRNLNNSISQKVLNRAAAIDCCTPELVAKNSKDFGIPLEKIFLVGNGTNTDRFQPRPSNSTKKVLGSDHLDPILGYVGGAPAERGGVEIIKAVAALKDEYPNIGAIIVGADPDGSLEQIALGSGVRERVVLPGVVSYEEIPEIVRSFDIGFALDRSSRVKVTGNSYQKVRQYLSCGKPVITCMDAHHDFVKKGLVQAVNPEDITEIINQIRKLLERTRDNVVLESQRAVDFAHTNLSTTKLMERRLKIIEGVLG